MSSATILPTSDELRDRPATSTFLGQVTRESIQRFAIAIGDTNPLYFDDEFAMRCGYPSIIAPPNFLTAVFEWGAGAIEQRLFPDGLDPAFVIDELQGCRLMGGGQSLTFLQPVCPGDIVTKERRLTALYKKQSRIGSLIFAISDDTYRDVKKGILLKCEDTLIAAESGPVRGDAI